MPVLRTQGDVVSLVLQIAINGEPPLGLVAVRRTSGGEQPDDLNTYEVRHFDLTGGSVRQVGDLAEVIHRYGDGAVVLAHKALGAVLS